MSEIDIPFLEAVTKLQESKSNLSYVFVGTNTNPSPIINTSWLEKVSSSDLVYGVEPFPEAYAKCINFFSEYPKIKHKILNFAISNKNEMVKLYQGVSDWNSGRLTGIHGTLIHPKDSSGEYNENMHINVNAITFQHFTHLLNINKIDILIVDVEGFELEILKQCLSLGFYPDLICYEEFNMSSNDKQECYDLLSERYNITKFKYDNLCLLKK